MSLNSTSLSDQDVRSISSTQGGEQLGELRSATGGRAYRYGLAAGADLAAGKLAQGATIAANHVNRTGVTTVAGQNQVTYAVGATAVTSNQYAQGFLVVNAGTGAGQTLLISGNTSALSSGSPTINLADSIITATSVSDSKFSLYPHPYSAGLIQATTLAAGAIGVPNVIITAAYYGWFQVTGVCSVLSDTGAPAPGAPVTYSDETAGAVGPYETDAVGVVLGWAVNQMVSAEYQAVDLCIN